ncbi:hypothetical protein VRK_16330 [Vibrio sp. MEBiC08052]|nr:hypothetical protein VRK_16330 [Vibrio sp. MEBiC08052]
MLRQRAADIVGLVLGDFQALLTINGEMVIHLDVLVTVVFHR